MTKQLDEHLTDKSESLSPNLGLVAGGLFIYFMLLFPSLFIYYAIGESAGLMAMLEKNQTPFGIFLKNAVFVLLIQFVVWLPHYSLLKRLYLYFQGSIVKTAISPVVAWFFIIVSMYLFEQYHSPSGNLLAPINVFLNVAALFSWYALLCLITSWYFHHQSKQKYIGTLFLHWLITLLLLLLKLV